jgi:hypothetical protein
MSVITIKVPFFIVPFLLICLFDDGGRSRPAARFHVGGIGLATNGFTTLVVISHLSFFICPLQQPNNQ